MRRWVLLLISALMILSATLFYALLGTASLSKFIIYLSDKIGQIASQVPENTFSAIFTSSIAILALVFTISQNLSKNYPPYILEKYKKDLRFNSTFWLFLTLMLLSLVSSISVFSNSVIRSITLILLISGIFSLIFYFRFVLTLMDSKQLLQLLLKDVERNTRRGKTEEVEKCIASIGDIAIKSLMKKEEKVVLECIDAFHELFKKYLNIFDKLKDKPDIIKKLRPVNMFYEKKDVVCRNLYDHLERVFLTALNNKEKRVTTEIALKLYDFMYAILERGDEVLFQQLIDTRRVKGAAYYHFFKNAVEYKENSKEIFVRNITSILQSYLIYEAELNQKLLNELVGIHLFRINKLIIDFDLFKSELDVISKTIVSLDPKNLLDDVTGQLNELVGDIAGVGDLNINRHLYNCIELLLRNFGNVDGAKKMLNKLKESLLGHVKSDDERQKIDEKFKDIQDVLRRYVILAGMYRTFFLVGAYILFCGQNKGINWKKYIKELWEHTIPPDAGANYLNKTPVCFDPLWLIYLLTYGGRNSTMWFDEYDFELEDYHGIRDYVYQYWILLMGKWSEELDLQNKSSIMNWKRSGHDFKLKIWYDLCNDFILYHKDRIRENFQKILQERLYEGIYTEDEIKELKAKFDELVRSMEKMLQILQK